MAHRCAICDRTDDKRLVVSEEQLYIGSYFKDERFPNQEICQDCQDAINEVLYPEEEDEYSFAVPV